MSPCFKSKNNHVTRPPVPYLYDLFLIPLAAITRYAPEETRTRPTVIYSNVLFLISLTVIRLPHVAEQRPGGAQQERLGCQGQYQDARGPAY